MREKFKIPQADKFVGKGDIQDPVFLESFGFTGGNSVLIDTLNTEEILAKIFHEKVGEPLEGELEKSLGDMELIKNTVSAVKKFASEFGRTEFKDIPMSHIHFLEPGGVSRITNGRLEIGAHSTIEGDILIEKRADLETAITLFHEMWHLLGSYSAIQLTEDGKIAVYRSGFTTYSRDGVENGFHHMDEGLTGIVTKRYVDEVLRKKPFFAKLIGDIEESGETVDTTRIEESAAIFKTADTLLQNTDKFHHKKDVIDALIKAQVTGNLLPIAKIIDENFGKGSFRKLGEIF